MNGTSAPDLPILADARLRAPFPAKRHGFVDGKPYITKTALRDRLDLVDPKWSISPPQLVTVHGDVVVMTATLTVLGAARSALGTGIIQTTQKLKDGRVIDLDGFALARNTAKAFKTAASDTLPRCALMFGIGDYLRLIPAEVRDAAALQRWFDDPKTQKLFADL